MGLKSLVEKMSAYSARLEQGKAGKIKAEDVQKVLRKLERKKAELLSELEDKTDPDKRARLERKIGVAREHIARAEWLLEQIE